MMNVSVLGLGNMGMAIAKSFSSGGSRVIGWNRSAREAANGNFRFESDLAAASSNSEILFIIPSDYAVATDLLTRVSETGHVEGKTVISAPSGTPNDAIRFAENVRALGGVPLDCAIMGYPGDIGSNRIYLLYSGSAEAFERVKPTLLLLGPNQVHVGAGASTAKAIDCGLLARSYSWLFGYFQALSLARAEGVDPDLFAKLSAEIIGPFQANVVRSTKAIVEDHFGPATQASVSVHRAALHTVIQVAKSHALDLPMLDICLDALDGAIDRGLGGSDIAAAYGNLESR